MQNTITDLKKIHQKLLTFSSYDTSTFSLIIEKINKVSKSWSGSLLGYQSNVYYKNFETPPKGAKFSQEWGINNPITQLDNLNMLGGSVGDWVEYSNDEVTNYINQEVDNLDFSKILKDSYDSSKMFEDCKDDVLLTINASGLLDNDAFLTQLVKKIEDIIIPSKEDFLKNNFPNKMSFSTRDTRADNKIIYPPHLLLESSIYEIIAHFTVIDSLEKNINQIIKYLSTKIKGKEMSNTNHNPLSNQIFIVHGHDDTLKIEVARFIEKLGLEAIILHEKASGGKTIIEKIEHYSNVSFGIVLYTQCDIGGTNQDNLQPRARQNVIFEHGYLIGKIGRKNVVALVKDKIEKPNDISGIVYIDTVSHWKNDLVKEMLEVGYDIDVSKIL